MCFVLKLNMLFRSSILTSVSAALLVAPTPAISQKVTSNFGSRADPFHGGRRAHKGLDIAAPTGSFVYATADGIVQYSGWKGSYGILITISHASGHETRFAHLSAVAVRAGQRVRKGAVIGKIGSTGRSTGPHLHYEVRLHGVALNPKNFM